MYLHGSSMGGIGTYDWAMDNPEHFAAIAIISGRGDVFRAPRLNNVPVWIFHGMKDKAVGVFHAETMLAALEESGASVRHTFYPEFEHGILASIESGPLYQWFLEHQRSNDPVPPDPLDELGIDSRGVGKKAITSIRPGRYALATSKSFQDRRVLRSRLYEVLRTAKARSQSLIQEQTLPSLPEGSVNLILRLPPELKLASVPEGIRVAEFPASRVVRFSVVDDNDGTLEKAIESTIEQLKSEGETPTREIRRTQLTGQQRRIRLIDIILK